MAGFLISAGTWIESTREGGPPLGVQGSKAPRNPGGQISGLQDCGTTHASHSGPPSYGSPGKCSIKGQSPQHAGLSLLSCCHQAAGVCWPIHRRVQRMLRASRHHFPPRETLPGLGLRSSLKGHRRPGHHSDGSCTSGTLTWRG